MCCTGLSLAESNVQLIAVSLAVIGLIVVVVSLLGCVGGHLENKLLLKTVSGLFTLTSNKETYWVI